MKNKSKTYMIIGISILIIAIIGSTFAYYVWNTTTDEETKIVTSIGAATVYFDGGSAIDNANIRPVSDKSKGIVKEIGVKASTNGISMNLYLDINTLPDAHFFFSCVVNVTLAASDAVPKLSTNLTYTVYCVLGVKPVRDKF